MTACGSYSLGISDGSTIFIEGVGWGTISSHISSQIHDGRETKPTWHKWQCRVASHEAKKIFIYSWIVALVALGHRLIIGAYWTHEELLRAVGKKVGI